MEEVEQGSPVKHGGQSDPYKEHYDLVKVILNDRERLIMSDKARCDEISYRAVFITDVVLFLLQIVTSAVFLGSWATLAAVRLPRLAIMITNRYFLDRF